MDKYSVRFIFDGKFIMTDFIFDIVGYDGDLSFFEQSSAAVTAYHRQIANKLNRVSNSVQTHSPIDARSLFKMLSFPNGLHITTVENMLSSFCKSFNKSKGRREFNSGENLPKTFQISGRDVKFTSLDDYKCASLNKQFNKDWKSAMYISVQSDNIGKEKKFIVGSKLSSHQNNEILKNCKCKMFVFYPQNNSWYMTCVDSGAKYVPSIYKMIDFSKLN